MSLTRRGLLGIPPMLLFGCARPSHAIIEPISRPVPEPSPSPSPALTSPYLDQVPKFGAAPTPEPVEVPDTGSTPPWSRVPTSHRVAFVTIDDGVELRPVEALELIQQARIPVSLFINSPPAAAFTPYFKAFHDTGAKIQNHTVTHRNLKGESYGTQHKEISDASDKLEELFGERPYLFRPPYGEFDRTTLKAARDCGMRVSLYWSHYVWDGEIQYQTAEKVVYPGDVMIMHFRHSLVDDLLVSLKAIYDSGLVPARLEDYIPRAA